MEFASLGGRERFSETRRRASDVSEVIGRRCLSKNVVLDGVVVGMLYGGKFGETFVGGCCCWSWVCSGLLVAALGVLTSPWGPNLASVRESTVAASSGSSTFHFFDRTLRIPKVRRAHSQPSAISSRCLTP